MKEDIKHVKINLNKNAYFESKNINNVINNKNTNCLLNFDNNYRNNLLPNNNTSFTSNDLPNINHDGLSFNKIDNKINENYTNNTFSQAKYSRIQKSILKNSSNSNIDNLSHHTISSILNPKNTTNHVQTRTNTLKPKQTELINSEIPLSNKKNNQSIKFNITPDNKKSKTEFEKKRDLYNNTENLLNGYSFSELQYLDKENNPPIPRESSRFTTINCENDPFETNIELGISHVNSDQNSKRIFEIPITIDTKYQITEKEILLNNEIEIPLVKEYLIIFNTLSLDFTQILDFLHIAAGKMNSEDKLYSNVFSNETWLKKADLEYLLYMENKLPYFQNISFLNTEGILQAINYCVDVSLENNSNIFSVVIINELRDLYLFDDNNLKDEYLKIAKKLKEKRVLMVKNFSINSILLKTNLSSNFTYEENRESEIQKFKFINFFEELSYLTMGLNYVVKVYKNFSSFKNLFFENNINNLFLGLVRISQMF